MFKQALALLRFLRAYASLTRDPNRLDMVFALLDHAHQVPEDQIPTLQLPELQSVLNTPARRLELDLDALSRLPRGTLGAEVARFLTEQGLDPNGLAHTMGDDGKLSRLKAHLESTHDVWHVITGAGTDVESELELQAFYYAQLAAPPNLIILSSGLLNAVLFARDRGPARMEALVRGWLLGRRARPLAGVDWSTWWATPLEEVRRAFQIDRAAVEPLLRAAPRLAA
ncbi:MAG: hypothetical protein H6713_40515 [Myxococcales bacterium]|nr:hypothetical protein [Myxococcales bacterium]